MFIASCKIDAITKISDKVSIQTSFAEKESRMFSLRKICTACYDHNPMQKLILLQSFANGLDGLYYIIMSNKAQTLSVMYCCHSGPCSDLLLRPL